MRNTLNPFVTNLVFCALLSLAIQAAAQQDASHNVLPAIAHFQGVGSIAGIGIQGKNLGDDDYSALAMVAVGDAQGALLSVSELPWANGSLSLTTALITDITLDTQYARGTNTSTKYKQHLSGLAQFARLNTRMKPHQHWYINAGLSLVSLEGYSDRQGVDIVINQSGLHDVFTTMAAVGINYDKQELSNNTQGLKANIELASLLFRPGQSDQAQLNYNTSYIYPINDATTLTGYIRGSHGFVLAKKADYDQVSEVLAEIDGQCDTAACTELENDLANYIVKGNNNGNAQALGGAYGLRSYSEQYIKGANTLLEGLELAITLPFVMKAGNSIELVSFVEAGQANDTFSELVNDSLYSLGAGARFNINKVPIRLEAAVGSDDTQAWFLTAGKRW